MVHPAESTDVVRRVDSPDLPPYYTFPLLEETGLITTGFSTRLGGVSGAPFDSLNLGTTTRDSRDCVRENRERFGRALGHPMLEWVRLEHGRDVHVVERFNASFEGCADQPGGDAVITRVPGLPLTMYYADCVPLVFLDVRTPAIGLAHAGWRGTVADVAQATVTAMQANFGTQPADLRVGIGSSIGPCCFEVDEDVSSVVRERFPQWQESVVSAKNNQKSCINLWALNALQLERAGVLRHNIAVSRMCTACREDLFFSYRRDRRQTGRLAMLAALR